MIKIFHVDQSKIKKRKNFMPKIHAPINLDTAKKITTGVHPVDTRRYDSTFKTLWLNDAVVALKIQDDRISDDLRAMLIEYAISTHGGRAL